MIVIFKHLKGCSEEEGFCSVYSQSSEAGAKSRGCKDLNLGLISATNFLTIREVQEWNGVSQEGGGFPFSETLDEPLLGMSLWEFFRSYGFD